jgi:hypothetical protein
MTQADYQIEHVLEWYATPCYNVHFASTVLKANCALWSKASGYKILRLDFRK